LPTINKHINNLAKILKHWATNFQFRRDGDFIKLLEINPRISSSTSIRAAFGYNESEMCIEHYLNNKAIHQPKILRGQASRYIADEITYDGTYF